MLSSLWNKAKSVATKVGNFLSTDRRSTQNTANAGMVFPLNPGASINTGKSTNNLEFYEVKSDGTAVGTGSYNRDTGQYGTNTNIISGGKTYYNAQTPGSAGSSAYQSETRPSTYVPPKKTSTEAERTDSYGRVSTQEQGNPYYVNDKLITPNAGFSGVGGSGGSGYQTTTPMTGLQGTSGFDLNRSYTSSGMGTTTAAYNQPNSDEEERKKTQSSGTQVVTPADQAQKYLGDTAPFMAQSTAQGPANPSVPPVIDAGFVQQMTEKVGALTSYTGADRNQIINNVMTDLQAAYNQLTVQAQNEGPMVQDTDAMMKFFEESATDDEAVAKKQAVDQWTAENTNLNQLLKDKSMAEKIVRANDEAFMGQINSIKDNPNLPKALARRQVTDLLAVNERANRGYMNRINDLAGQIATQQRNVEMAFQLKRDAESDYKWAKEQQDKYVNRYFSNPMMFAALTPAQLDEVSKLTGYSVKSLKALGDKALEGDIITNEDGKGNWVAKDKNTGKTIWSAPGFAKPTGGGGGGEKFTSGGLTIPGSKVAQAEQSLLSSRGEDNYVDPSVYLKLYKDWVAGGGLVSDFTKQFPPENYVNPANTWLPKEIMPKSKVNSIL